MPSNVETSNLIAYDEIETRQGLFSKQLYVAINKASLRVECSFLLFLLDRDNTAQRRSFCYIYLYYIDTSVLLENRPLVKFIRNYIRDPIIPYR